MKQKVNHHRAYAGEIIQNSTNILLFTMIMIVRALIEAGTKVI